MKYKVLFNTTTTKNNILKTKERGEKMYEN